MVLQPSPDADPEAVATFDRALASAGVTAMVVAAAYPRPPRPRPARPRSRDRERTWVPSSPTRRRTTPADPLARTRRRRGPAGRQAPFSEGTQALLDRLERLADLRDRGLLAPEEYETAKETMCASWRHA